MDRIDELIMDAYYKVVPMEYAFGGAEMALATIVREVQEAHVHIEALEAALRPFAALCDWLSSEPDPTQDIGAEVSDTDVLLVTDWEVPSEDRDEVTAGMIRAARDALSQGQGAGAEAQGLGTRDEGEHTPGPWMVRFAQNEAEVAEVSTLRNVPASAVRIAIVYGQLGAAEANAALIAAAPSLLALIEAVEWVDEAGALVKACAWCGGSQVFGHKDDCSRQRALARAQGQREQEAERG